MTIPNDKKYSGCTVLERGTGFISDEICRHNRLIARYEGWDFEDYSHAEKLRWDEDTQQLMTFGARIHGVEESKVQDYYNKGHKIKILWPVTPLTREDNYNLKGFWLMADPKKYAYLSLGTWIADVHFWGLLPDWLWRNRRRFYCYKMAAQADKWIGNWPLRWSTDKVSLGDLLKNPIVR